MQNTSQEMLTYRAVMFFVEFVKYAHSEPISDRITSPT